MQGFPRAVWSQLDQVLGQQLELAQTVFTLDLRRKSVRKTAPESRGSKPDREAVNQPHLLKLRRQEQDITAVYEINLTNQYQQLRLTSPRKICVIFIFHDFINKKKKVPKATFPTFFFGCAPRKPTHGKSLVSATCGFTSHVCNSNTPTSYHRCHVTCELNKETSQERNENSSGNQIRYYSACKP